MRILFGITHVTRDCRTKEQREADRVRAQERADQALEQEWRRRVENNIRRRRDRRITQFLNTGASNGQ